LKSKNNYILYIANDDKQLTTTCFGLYKGHFQIVHLVQKSCTKAEDTLYILQLFSQNV